MLVAFSGSGESVTSPTDAVETTYGDVPAVFVDHASEGGNQPLVDTYGDHLPWVQSQPDAEQPFTLT